MLRTQGAVIGGSGCHRTTGSNTLLRAFEFFRTIVTFLLISHKSQL